MRCLSGRLRVNPTSAVPGWLPRNRTAKPSGLGAATPGLHHRFLVGENLGVGRHKSPYSLSVMATTLAIPLLPLPLMRPKSDQRTGLL